jgi:hypothetical protein
MIPKTYRRKHKYKSNGILLVTNNSYYVGQIISQSSTVKYVVALYIKIEVVHDLMGMY